MSDSPVAAYRRYALEVLLPLCRDRFADPVHGGFYERLGADLVPEPLGSKRLMVQCRQLYVLAHAAVLGDASGEAAAERGYAFLRRAYRDHRHGGWFFRASDAGAPIERMKDAYSHSFVLFALAWLHRAFGAPDALAEAAATYDALAVHLAGPGGGFWDAASEDWAPERALRRQNPHMHLLEALLALHEASGEGRWLGEAEALVRLFLERLFDPATGTLGEFFTVDWRPDPERGHIVEPGHHFEWVWLLHRYRAAGGTQPVDEASARLFDFAETHGYDREHGGIHDQVDRSGVPVLHSRRIWPVTEAIKAHTTRIETGAPDRLAEHLFRDFLRPARHGWVETLTREGAPGQTSLPGSTPYHLFLAAAEATRAAEALG